MKKMIYGLLAALLLGTGLLQGQSAKIAIVPKPAKIITFGTAAVLTGQTPVYLDEKSGLDKDYVSRLLREAGIDPVYVAKAKKAKIVLRINDVPLNNNDEAYRLAVMSPDSKKQIVATADAKAGLHYAVQTLCQLPEEVNGALSLPGCVITDAPAFPWRAFMLDESRHFHGMQTVKDLLDEMARLKMNTFHWHLVDDPGWRIEIEKYPRPDGQRLETRLRPHGRDARRMGRLPSRTGLLHAGRDQGNHPLCRRTRHPHHSRDRSAGPRLGLDPCLSLDRNDERTGRQSRAGRPL